MCAVPDQWCVALSWPGAQRGRHTLSGPGGLCRPGQVATDDVTAIAKLDLRGCSSLSGRPARGTTSGTFGVGSAMMTPQTSLMPPSRTPRIYSNPRCSRAATVAALIMPIGDDADPVGGEADAQVVDHRNQVGAMGGVAGPHLRADRSSFLVDDDADDHLV